MMAPSCAKNGGTLFNHTGPAFVGIVQMLERFHVRIWCGGPVRSRPHPASTCSAHASSRAGPPGRAHGSRSGWSSSASDVGRSALGNRTVQFGGVGDRSAHPEGIVGIGLGANEPEHRDVGTERRRPRDHGLDLLPPRRRDRERRQLADNGTVGALHEKGDVAGHPLTVPTDATGVSRPDGDGLRRSARARRGSRRPRARSPTSARCGSARRGERRRRSSGPTRPRGARCPSRPIPP